MAIKDKNSSSIPNMKKINDTLDHIESRLSDIYRSTYYTLDTEKKSIENLDRDISNRLNQIIANNSDLQGISNISRLYSRLEQKPGENGLSYLLDPSKKPNGKSLDNDLLSLFNDNTISANLMETYSQNRWILALDQEIDTVLKYMPKLKEALDIKKDNIISADNFTKNFINVKKDISDKDAITFNNRIEEIKKKYKLAELFDEMVDEAQTKGEYFLYLVPYKQAFEKLLDIKNTLPDSGRVISEETLLESSPVEIHASTDDSGNPMLIVHKTGMLESVIENIHKVDQTISNTAKSLTEMFTEAAEGETYYLRDNSKKDKPDKTEKIELDKMMPNELEFPVDDGLLDTNKYELDKKNKKKSGTKTNVPGAVVKKLDRTRILPIYIEDICMGYYYIEAMPLMGDPNRYSIGGVYDTHLTHDATTPDGVDPSSSNLINAIATERGENDVFLKKLAHTISEKIDAQFINSNQDLSKEIYMILKYDQRFNQGYIKTNVTFLPADDVIHFKFKTDPTTHRGISDLYQSLIPAKMWAMLNLCTTLGILTRGQDKRVYYVKQTVETNVSKTLMNVVNQIKKGNFGVRQMESINNILNIIGRFNDFVIPVGQSGDSPINFEIMQGQQFQTDENLMDKLEDAAVSAIVPLELVQTVHSQIDYAIQLSMSNSKFLRIVYKRQSICEYFFSIIMTKIYNYEYDETETINMSLPSPAFLSLSNTSTLIQNATEFVENVMNFEGEGEKEEVKARLKRKLMRYYLNTHLNTTLIDKMKEEARLEIQVEKNQEES